MNAKRLPGLLVIALSLPGIADAAEAVKLRRLVPKDAFFYVGVDDVTQIRALWDKTSLARFWKDPAVRQFTAPLRKEIEKGWQEFKEEENISDDWPSYLPGEVVFFSERIRREGEIFEMPMCFAAKTGLPRERYLKLINKYLETFPPDARKRQYTAEGITVRMAEYREELPARERPMMPMPNAGAPAPVADAPKSFPAYFQYAFADDVILLSDGDESVMRGMIRRLKTPPGETVADVSALKRVRGLLPGDGHVTGYLAVNQFFGLLLDQIKAATAMAGAAGGPAQMFNPGALGLDRFQGIGLGVHLSEQRFTIAAAVDLPQQGPGLVAILRKIRRSPLSTLAITPSTALSYSSTAVDWAGLWNEVRSLIRAFAPPADFTLTMLIQGWENNLGMKIPDILGAFGEEFSYFVSVPPGPSKKPQYTVLIAVKDQQRLRQTIDTLVTFLHGRARLDATEFLGHTIRTVRPMASPGTDLEAPGGEEEFQLSWVLANDVLAISGSMDSLKQVLQLKTGKRKDSLATSALYREARALLPKKLDGFEFVEAGGFAELFLGQLLEMGRGLEAGQGDDAPFDFKASITGETARRYFGLIASGTQIDANGIAWVSVMQAPKP